MSNKETRMSKNDKQQAIVPRLRFPEFRETGKWAEQKLSEVLTEHGLKSTGGEEVFSVSVHKGLVDQIEHLGRSYSADKTDHYNRVLPGDIVYTKSPTGDFPLGVIKQSQANCQVIVSPLYGVFTPESISVGRLIDAYFSSPYNAKTFLAPIVNKGAKNTINVTNAAFLSKNLLLPRTKEEQQKIADCLGSLDDLIAAEGRKLAALRDHKEGLMQQLFPREGETCPRLRFPEFRNSGDWKARKINNVLTKKAESATLDDNGVYREIGVRSHGKGLFHKEPITGKALGAKRVFHVVPDALVINIVFAWEQALAVTTRNEAGFIASHRFPMFVAKANRCDVAFMQRLFLTPIGKHLLRVASPGGAGRNRTLNQKEFEKLDVVIPSPAEQQRIADCFSTLDVLIAAQAEKLDALRTHKRGLMQQLFPSLEDAEA